MVGVPVTLNGDLKNQFVETNVGFDTICKVLVQLCQSYEKKHSSKDCFFRIDIVNILHLSLREALPFRLVVMLPT